MRRNLMVVLAVAAALVLAACGGSRLSKADYERKVKQIGGTAGTALNQIFASKELQDPKSLKEAAGVIRKGAQAIDQAGRQIAALNPPADAEKDNTDLAKGLQQLANDITTLATNAEKGDLAKVRAFDEQASANQLASERLVQSAVNDLKAKGYDVGS